MPRYDVYHEPVKHALIKDGSAQAGFLGLLFETYTDPSTGNPGGARVLGLQPGSPAGATGSKNPLMKDDVIQKVIFGGSTVKVLTASDLTNALVMYPAETKVSITYKRQGKLLTWSGALGVK